MKKLIIVNILFWALCIFIPMQVKADPKTEATVGHVISETINGSDIDISYIMEKELEAIAQKFMIESISVLQAYLPAILDGVAADLRLKVDEAYKCKLLENGGMNDGCN